MLSFITKLVLKLPLTSPTLWLNVASLLAAVLWLTGAWQLAPNVAVAFFGVVNLTTLVFRVGGHWIEQAIQELD